jgi:hypothetical protein
LLEQGFSWQRLALATQDIDTTRALAKAKGYVALSRRFPRNEIPRLRALFGGTLER